MNCYILQTWQHVTNMIFEKSYRDSGKNRTTDSSKYKYEANNKTVKVDYGTDRDNYFYGELQTSNKDEHKMCCCGRKTKVSVQCLFYFKYSILWFITIIYKPMQSYFKLSLTCHDKNISTISNCPFQKRLFTVVHTIAINIRRNFFSRKIAKLFRAF